MKLFKTLTAFFFILIFSGSAISQSVKIGVEVGATLPQSDYGGSTIDFYQGTKYGMKSGVNFGAVGKFGLPTFTIRGGIGYFNLKNDGIAQTGNPGGRIETENHILSFLAGPEFQFSVIGSPLRPYIGANIILSSIGGEVTFQGVSNVPSGTYTISSGTRFGLGLGAGAEISLTSVILDLGIRYNLHNLGGKEFVQLASDRRLDSYINLNDERDPLFNNSTTHFISSDRNISTFQFNLGLLFGVR
jgi:opacity protein-like surface antigen